MTAQRTLDNFMSQKDTAEYISRHYEKMDASELSTLTKNGDGPDFVRRWGRKLFHVDDVDQWIQRQKEATADTDTPKQ
jgi:hypothetical protein